MKNIKISILAALLFSFSGCAIDNNSFQTAQSQPKQEASDINQSDPFPRITKEAYFAQDHIMKQAVKRLIEKVKGLEKELTESENTNLDMRRLTQGLSIELDALKQKTFALEARVATAEQNLSTLSQLQQKDKNETNATTLVADNKLSFLPTDDAATKTVEEAQTQVKKSKQITKVVQVCTRKAELLDSPHGKVVDYAYNRAKYKVDDENRHFYHLATSGLWIRKDEALRIKSIYDKQQSIKDEKKIVTSSAKDSNKDNSSATNKSSTEKATSQQKTSDAISAKNENILNNGTKANEIGIALSSVKGLTEANVRKACEIELAKKGIDDPKKIFADACENRWKLMKISKGTK